MHYGIDFGTTNSAVVFLDERSNRPVSYTHLTPADERSSVDLGGRRIITKKTKEQ